MFYIEASSFGSVKSCYIQPEYILYIINLHLQPHIPEDDPTFPALIFMMVTLPFPPHITLLNMILPLQPLRSWQWSYLCSLRIPDSDLTFAAVASLTVTLSLQLLHPWQWPYLRSLCVPDGDQLLSNDRQHLDVDTIELIKAAPGARLRQSGEETTHHLQHKPLPKSVHTTDLHSIQVYTLNEPTHFYTWIKWAVVRITVKRYRKQEIQSTIYWNEINRKYVIPHWYITR